MQGWNEKEEFKIIIGEQTPKVDDFQVPVSGWIKENGLLLKQFLAFSFSLPTALGVAANQVAWKGNRLTYRFFSHRIGRSENDPFEIMISPVIIKKYGEPITEFEGCLCWPRMTIKAQRWLRIDVEYYDINGNKISASPNREGSQVWQHEMDHLDGIEEQIVHGTIKVDKKAERNSPCPCGSGVKYKKCCGK